MLNQSSGMAKAGLYLCMLFTNNISFAEPTRLSYTDKQTLECDNKLGHKIDTIYNTRKIQEFKIQDQVSPLIPFCSITGKPTKSQIQKFLDNYKRVGIDQFIIYPRSGLELEYMGEDWLAVCGYFIEYARENGMFVWLYDEFNWPSGTCKGQVMKRDENYASKKISILAEQKSHRPENNHSDLKKTSYSWTVLSVPLYVDYLNPQATKSFIELTHEKYYKRFGKYFGNVIKGFFTDEPSPKFVATNHRIPESLLELPFWDELDKEYSELTNRNFRFDVEAHLNGHTPENLWKDYFYLLGRRFRYAYLDKLRNWCEQHNVIFTGHLKDESYPPKSILANGNPMMAINSFTLPGIDEINTNTRKDAMEWETMKIIENISGGKSLGALAELFAYGPCDMPIGKMRQMIWSTALHGVNHYVLAIAALDSRASVEKTDYFNSFTTTQPWFEALTELSSDAKLAAKYAIKKYVSRIAIRYPQTLTSASIFNDTKNNPTVSLQQLLRKLSMWQWDCRLVDESEKPDSSYKVVLTFDKKGLLDELSGNYFGSLDELYGWLNQHLQREVIVENMNGDIQDNILVKKYMDGSICVVSLSDIPIGTLKLRQPNNNPIVFEMPQYGVFVHESQNQSNKHQSEIRISSEELLNYEIISSNSTRIVFDNSGRFDFTLLNDFKNLIVGTRNFADTVKLHLDGKKLVINNKCKQLPDGLNELYLQSDNISLKRGKHTLTLKSKNVDFPYVPSALIFGNFAVKNNNVLSQLPRKLSIGAFRNQGLPNYIGSVTFSKRLKIKEENLISINTANLVAEAFINGQSLGRKAWAPFEWLIPEKFKDKTVDLKVKVTTSVGPLFGTYPWDTGKEGSLQKRFAPDNHFLPE